MKIRDRSSKGHRVVGVCYKPPDQGKPVDEAFLRQLQEVLRSRAPVLMGDSTSQISAGIAARQVADDSGDFWSLLRIASSSRY